jgi:hypothetical protein
MGIACPLAIVFLVFLPFAVLALHDVNRPRTRQFTIRGMLLFIFLWAVCLSQTVPIRRGAGGTVGWWPYFTVPFAWIVLAICYVATRQFAALLIQGSGVLFIGVLSAIALVGGGERNWSDIGMYFFLAMIGGSFLGLIFFSLMMILAMVRRPLSAPPPREEDHQP